MEEGQELEHKWLNRSVETAQKRVEERNYLARKRTLEFDDVMNMQREVVYGYRNEAIETEDPRKIIFEAIDEMVPLKVREYLNTDDGEEANTNGLLNWVNTTFPLGLSAAKAGFDQKSKEESAEFLIEKIKQSYDLKCSHEDPTAVIGLERYIILNAVDRLWQEHLYAMDSLREAVYLRAYGQKDPLVEYKTEAYEMFIELMGNIKNEVLHNLFRSTSNLLAFENFLANLPQNLQRPEGPTQSGPAPGSLRSHSLSSGEEKEELELPLRREVQKVGRNDVCPCGSGKKFKNCCGRTA